VVVPTFRRRDRLLKTLNALEGQSIAADRFEVVVCDDGSEDGTLEHLRAYADGSPLHITVVSGPNAGPAAARNRGIAKARGPWVAFTDDDCVPEPDWLERHLEFLRERPELGGAGGKVVRLRDSFLGRYVDWTGVMMPLKLPDGSAEYLVTANAVYRRELLVALGGFTTTFKWPGGEDPDLSLRARQRGAVLGIHPAAVVGHDHRDTLRGIYRMFWHHGLGAGVAHAMAGVGSPPAWGRTLRKKWIPRTRRAFAQRPPWTAACYSLLELLRAAAFHAGSNAHQRMVHRGTTSSN